MMMMMTMMKFEPTSYCYKKQNIKPRRVIAGHGVIAGMPGWIGDTGFTGATGATGPVSIGMFVC